MKHVISRITFLTLIIAVTLCFTAQSSNIKDQQKAHRALKGNVDVSKALAYAFPAEKAQSRGDDSDQSNRVPLGGGSLAMGYASPGLMVGNTWYDWQQNGSMGRMIETGPHSGHTGPTIVHMGWMYLPDKKLENRSYAYNYYSSQVGTVPSEFEVLMSDEYGGFVNVDVTPDNRAIVGGHNDDGTGYDLELYIQWADSWIVWRIPDSVQGWAQNDPTERALWPKFFFQYGTDTVAHVVALISDNDNIANAIVYYRRVGHEFSTEAGWDYPPYIVDTVQTFGHNIIGQRQGDRVALAWTASLPYDGPWCDTCSGISIYDGYVIGEMDNDLYCQQSLDQGATWERRANITQIPIGGAAYKPVGDISLLFDTNDYLHIVYPACPWPSDLCWDEGGFCWSEDWYVDNARLMHWSDNVPYIRPIADQVYDVQDQLWDSCWAGARSLRIAKPSIAECDGKLYTIWTQFNNPKEGLIDDCAEWGYESGDPTGAANGELWLSISSDWGMTWDYQRNLTQSYTPHCDPKLGENCQSDNWASMTRYGKQVGTGENWSAADIVDPSGGSYLGDYYLDIQYVNDLDAGSVIMHEGSWTDSPIKWFRMPCFDHVPCPVFRVDWTHLGLPTYVRPGTSLDTTLMLENIGNTGLNYTVEVIYDDGSSGWLGISNFSGFIPSGLTGFEYGIIRLNQNLMTEIGDYYGRLRFETNACNQTEPFDVEIVLCIRDTVPPVYWDSVQTNCLSLIVSNTGNTGNMGRMGRGKVNMDYYPEDCDSTAQVYLFDGSPIVMGINGADTVINSAFYGVNHYAEAGFYPGYPVPVRFCPMYGGVQVFETGHFIAESFPLAIDKVYVAPAFDCEWIIQYMRVRSADDLLHEDVMLGEAIDWDVPWDYRVDDPSLTRGFVNYGGVDPARRLIYQQGYDAHGAGSDTLYPYNCQFNDNRFAGMAFVESYLNSSLKASYPYSAFVAENDSLLIYNGFDPGSLYQEMTMSGFRSTDSLEDLHSVMCFENAIDIGPEDVYEVVTVIATVQNGTLSDLQAAIDDAKAWYEAKGGIWLFDAEYSWLIFDCSYCCLFMGKFYNDGQPFSILDIDNFTEWLLRNPGVTAKYDCLEQVDVSGSTLGVPDHYVNILDLDYLVGYLLRGDYPSLPPCPQFK